MISSDLDLAGNFKLFSITMAAVHYPWQQATHSVLDQCERVESRRAELQELLTAKSNDEAGT